MHHIKLDTRVQYLDFVKPWTQLTDQERNYAYYIYKASWAGALMVPHQISYEAPALFTLFQAYFQQKDLLALEEAAATHGVTQEEWQKFVAYVGGFYGNMSNYHSFGDMKFVPEIPQEKFRAILYSNPLYSDATSFYAELLDRVYPLVEREIFALEKPFTTLNYPEKGGITAYFSSNMVMADLDLVREFLADQKINPLNTRAFKRDDGTYLITVGSINTGEREVTFKDKQFTVQHGEFSKYLEECNQYLEQAKLYAANDLQREMIELYIEHFKTGDIETHKESQRRWIKDKGPVVECNMGWIEVYIDPENIRAYFEGWVAVVDKQKSLKFQKLVENSEQIIPLLPWPKEMEKDSFLAPDFTTLDIIAFATNSCPLGINIPNYDDIRDNEGFKNVFLNNSMPSYAISAMQFATEEQTKVLVDNTTKCYEVHVACHELLGHGVGKLIYRSENIPEFVDPVTGEKFTSCYEEGEDWNGKFGSISTSYEECRADTCGFYLCTLPEVYTLFGFEDHEVDTVLWVNVMNQFRKGILGLQLFNVETNKWGQAHTWGAYVFSQYIYQNQKSKIVDFEIVDANNFYIHLDKELLAKEGKELIREFLMILQTYKSSGAIDRAEKFWQRYSIVDGIFLKIRDIVIEKKKPRRIELNANLVRNDENDIQVVNYSETFEQIIHSYAQRYPTTKEFLFGIVSEWDRTREFLRVKQ
ncbi:dipeptidyl-peptidase 3 [Stylonychia lemnae]|uniref:dipeptidyl-peptidase III n=1 Tax=Stylonychia lemnae TaxID=5949 RepID=A0A078A6L5_STYLE|nr:dipeptidyl-peptidase 3 [Stylonychia lemnae]|eukprot:CDW76384.1 dipeptidyl-peptidase 3 [Stylonychia lemnae]